MRFYELGSFSTLSNMSRIVYFFYISTECQANRLDFGVGIDIHHRTELITWTQKTSQNNITLPVMEVRLYLFSF